MLETSFSSFISKTNKQTNKQTPQQKQKQKQNKKQKQKQKNTGEILIFRTFLAKNSILAYISLKIAKLGKLGNYDVIVTSYTAYLYFFGMYGKRRPIAILWYQISRPQAFIFQAHRRVATTPLG